MIRNIYIIKNGILLYSKNFNVEEEESSDIDDLLAGFLAISIFFPSA